MAITGPADLPSVLKLRSEPMKKYVLTKLGYPVVDVEITEDQWETIWKVSGDFIAGYFPREQKLSLFYTTPLQSTYPLPKDAYWVQEVSWDPVTTRIDDVFGAESFLFCVSEEFQILDKFGSLQPVADWRTDWKAKTPFGPAKMTIKKHQNEKLLPKVKITYENGSIEATTNHVIKSNNSWHEFGEVMVGDTLNGWKSNTTVCEISISQKTDAIGIRANRMGCYYGCIEGEPVLLH